MVTRVEFRGGCPQWSWFGAILGACAWLGAGYLLILVVQATLVNTKSDAWRWSCWLLHLAAGIYYGGRYPRLLAAGRAHRGSMRVSVEVAVTLGSNIALLLLVVLAITDTWAFDSIGIMITPALFIIPELCLSWLVGSLFASVGGLGRWYDTKPT